MKKLASCFVGVGLSALALSGCAAASAAGVEPTPSASVEQVLAPIAAEGTPADAATPADDEFWQLNQAPLGTATAAIEEQFVDEFAYAFFDEVSAMHVAFAGRAPAEAVALLQATHLPHVVIESVGFNAAEYQAAADDVAKQTRKYVTEERQVAVSQDPSAGPGAITVSFLSLDPELTTDPGIIKSLTVDAAFTISFDSAHTSPIVFETGTEKVAPSVE